MSDRKRYHDKKEKQVEMEEMDKQYVERPTQYMCPMMYQCPMVNQCPIMGGQMQYQMPMPVMNGQMMQQPMGPQNMMPTQQMIGDDMRIKDWFDDWDEFSEDSSFEFDSDDLKSPEKYYKKFYKNKKHNNPYFWPPYFPYHKK